MSISSLAVELHGLAVVATEEAQPAELPTWVYIATLISVVIGGFFLLGGVIRSIKDRQDPPTPPADDGITDATFDDAD